MKEKHRSQRIGWLRAAVLGANDGILSTSSLVVGVASSGSDHSGVLLAGLAGLVAGAMSMAAGEYVSVSSQSDTEAADLKLEKKELAADAEGELAELAAIYEERGVSAGTARAVAEELTRADALSAHAREELGISEIVVARPVQAALASACLFAIGAAVPLAAALLAPVSLTIPVVSISSLVCLAILGGLAARVGGAPVMRASLRVLLWGALAMGATSLIGMLFGVSGV